MPRLTEQQQRAVETIDSNVLVSAGAGSGKTMVLVERFLEVLKKYPDADVQEIIAVTFTRKAAEEMRSRLKARLRETVDAATAEEKPRWSKMLAEVDRARIGTIHSLCESLLRAYPAEAGVDPQFELLDELSRAEMLNEAIEQVLHELIAEPSEEQLLLLEYPIESIRNWVQQQLKSIPQYKESRAKLGASREQFRSHAESTLVSLQTQSLQELKSDKALANGLRFLEDNPWSDPESNIEIKRRALLQAFNLAFNCGDDPERRVLAVQAIREASELPPLRTAGGAKAKPLRDEIKSVQEFAKDFADKIPVALTDADEHAFVILESLTTVIDKAIAVYETAKEQAQKVDYNDLIGKAHSLVFSENSSARKSYSEKLRAILVDEFQDTNNTQAGLVSSLCGQNSRLFLIGDDKQSIYKFQGADVSTFNSWKQLIETQTHGLSGEGLLLDLSASFRSHPSIVEFVNRFFKFYFSSGSESESHYRARHQSLVPSRSDEHDAQRVEIVAYEVPIDDPEALSTRTVESNCIASWIAEKINAGVMIFDKALGIERALNYGDFAILVQANVDFGVIESALSEAQIPYVTFAGSGFLTRQEIYDIENMLRWLSCTEDDHALIAVLRAPFFALNDGVIHKLVTDDTRYVSLWQKLQKQTKDGELAQTLARPVQVLKYLLERSTQERTSDLVRSIIAATAYDTVVLSLPNGKQKSRNVWKFASFAQQYNHLSLHTFLSALQSMRDLGVNNQTDAPLNATDSVKLMTIHKSKGLEFPAVILPAMSRKIHLMAAKLLVHRDFGLAFDTTRNSDEEKPSFYRAASALNMRMDEEEKKRLLYVAMTRARDYLAMFYDRNARGAASFRLWLREALGIDCGEDESSPRASLSEGTHYVCRYVDSESISEWQSQCAGLAAKAVAREELEQLAKEAGFELLEPVAKGIASAPVKKVAWQKTLRVTTSNETDKLPSTIVGNLFHAAMQQLALRPAESIDRELLENLALAPDIGAAEKTMRDRLVTTVEGLLEKFQGSKLWGFVHKAQRIMPEVSYTTIEKTVGFDKRPDLIFQDQHAHWHIVDFKTDNITAEQIDVKVNEHSAQVLEYVRDFKELTGFHSQGWLYFAHLGEMVAVRSAGYSVSKGGQLRLPLGT